MLSCCLGGYESGGVHVFPGVDESFFVGAGFVFVFVGAAAFWASVAFGEVGDPVSVMAFCDAEVV